MPVLLPPPMPRFSCSTTRTSGYRSRTSASVPSVEPWSTTSTSTKITSWPRTTESRQRSIHSAAFQVTTTTETSATAEQRQPPVEDLLPHDHDEAGQGEQNRHHEEEETAGEGGIGRHVELPEEAHEESLADAETVDRERHEHHQEEQRAQHDVRQRREVDADRAAAGVDRADSRQLQSDRHDRDEKQRARVFAIPVDAGVDRARRGL